VREYGVDVELVLTLRSFGVLRTPQDDNDFLGDGGQKGKTRAR
jgi:hypothetical protein